VAGLRRVADRGSSGLPNPGATEVSYLEGHFYAGGNSLMLVRHAPLFVFASFARVNGQRAVRVFFECNTRASNGQRAIRAASACNMRASTRASVFGDDHAFSCWSQRNILRKLEGEVPKFFSGRGKSFRFGWPICSKRHFSTSCDLPLISKPELVAPGAGSRKNDTPPFFPGKASARRGGQ
jgi:hypothetical protein